MLLMGIKGQIQKTVTKKASREFDWLFKIIRESFSSLQKLGIQLLVYGGKLHYDHFEQLVSILDL